MAASYPASPCACRVLTSDYDMGRMAFMSLSSRWGWIAVVALARPSEGLGASDDACCCRASLAATRLPVEIMHCQVRNDATKNDIASRAA